MSPALREGNTSAGDWRTRRASRQGGDCPEAEGKTTEVFFHRYSVGDIRARGSIFRYQVEPGNEGKRG
ncbi:hypothetical protein ACF3DV_14565 [Chlorogloeopsis fritschii PCC 9212]|uniref:hypothetical protein n=1 Tax=Chlorogloeopsis fritschii TaxID=1124 RepID=UPI000309B3F9|nr:hypothetical protein [Chlorogloeopsis fritschii]MBF2005007.1 hypothetical protein [Chlorogloeopsis fritschii C42_A2020_084]